MLQYEEREIRDNSLSRRRWWSELNQGYLTLWRETPSECMVIPLIGCLGPGADLWGEGRW